MCFFFQIQETGNFTESFGKVFHVSGKVRVYVVMSESIYWCLLFSFNKTIVLSVFDRMDDFKFLLMQRKIVFIFIGSKTKNNRKLRNNFECLWQSGRVCGVDGKTYKNACHAARLWAVLRRNTVLREIFALHLIIPSLLSIPGKI